MPWFQCESCGETLKKPKVLQHANMCGSSWFSCIDCSRQFDRNTVQGHTSCVTEHDKYALGATKPGGYAAKGFYNDPNATDNATKNANGDGAVAGLEFLSTRPPWKCSLCNVACTSQDTLMSHAQGTKHVRRARAALKSASTQNGGDGGTTEQNNGADNNTGGDDNNGKTKDNNDGDKKIESDSKAKEKKEKKKEEKKVKWKKLAVKELKKHDGKMKIKELLSALLSDNSDVDSDDVLNKLKKKTKIFKFDKKTISLID